MDISVCSGRVIEFYYNPMDFYQSKPFGSPQWSLPGSNRFHVATMACFCGSMVVTPVLYAAIYRSFNQLRYSFAILLWNRFRKNQDKRAPGLSITARKTRRTRNLVSMKFNIMNWLLETVSTVLVLIGENRFFTILYLLVNSCGTPLVIISRF